MSAAEQQRPALQATGRPLEYLTGDEIIQVEHPEVRLLAHRLRADHPDDLAVAHAAFEWVRDQVAHSFDAQDPRVTLTASEVLAERVGLCFAKSHLLAAVLRVTGIPTALCYQRVRDRTGTPVLHGLVAVHLGGIWHRQDVRGNRPGVDARFSVTGERLAFTPDPALGERDFPELHLHPAPAVTRALRAVTNVLDVELPEDPGPVLA